MKRLFYSLMVYAALNTGGRAAAADKKPSVMVAPIRTQSLSDRMLYPAALAPNRIVPVHTDSEGLVKSLLVDLGQSVRSGQTLGLISNPDPGSGFKPYTLTAPISGIITTLDIAVGDRVTRDRVLLVIADLRSYKVKINLTAFDLLNLRPKDQGILTLQGRSLKVAVRAMSPMIDPATGTAACELEILAPSADLKTLIPGSLGQVVFETNQRKGIVVPEDAVVYRGKDAFVVQVTAQNTAAYVAVKIVRYAVGEMEITGRLQDGDSIVTGSTAFIVEGEALDPQRDKESSGPGKGTGP